MTHEALPVRPRETCSSGHCSGERALDSGVSWRYHARSGIMRAVAATVGGVRREGFVGVSGGDLNRFVVPKRHRRHGGRLGWRRLRLGHHRDTDASGQQRDSECVIDVRAGRHHGSEIEGAGRRGSVGARSRCRGPRRAVDDPLGSQHYAQSPTERLVPAQVSLVYEALWAARDQRSPSRRSRRLPE